MSTIYTQRQGHMTKVAEPRLPDHANFVIVWKDKDWSGYRTLAECEQQFPSLEARPDADSDNFSVEERP